MLLTIVFALALASPADSIEAFYAEKNVDALQALYARAADRETALLCRYRLYPLTEDEAYLDALPTELEDGTARELALLSGLWGYRAARASLPRLIKYGLRSSGLLDQAKALDPDDPYVLLIEGQSLLFRPGFAGGDKHKALERFLQLQEALAQASDSGISPMEAELWTWYTLEKMKAPRARALRERLLSQQPPVLYREFLQDPP
jgi:hypothetical protein